MRGQVPGPQVAAHHPVQHDRDVPLRVLLGGDKVYLLGAFNTPATATPADVTKFMDSFTLLPAKS